MQQATTTYTMTTKPQADQAQALLRDIFHLVTRDHHTLTNDESKAAMKALRDARKLKVNASRALRTHIKPVKLSLRKMKRARIDTERAIREAAAAASRLRRQANEAWKARR
ncbi:MAG: hypothetical protein DDT25_01251 [Chloroflexi bacterium]|nr:hypothetical protein [Chloroflexota bacterium]